MVNTAPKLSVIVVAAMVVLLSAAHAEHVPGAATSPKRAERPASAETQGPDLARLLNLTADQMERLRDINERVSHRLREAKEDFRDDVLGVLTDKQRLLLEQLLERYADREGPPIDLDKALELTDPQKDLMKRLQAAHQIRLDAMWDDYIGQIKGILTPTQAATFDDYLRQEATAP